VLDPEPGGQNPAADADRDDDGDGRKDAADKFQGFGDVGIHGVRYPRI